MSSMRRRTTGTRSGRVRRAIRCIFPYWQNYECVSDQDFVCRYSDDNVLNIDNHTPLHLDIIQSTYSWSSGQLAEFLLHKYIIINKKMPLKDVYIAFWMHSAIGNIGAADNFIDEYTRYYPKYKMAVAEDSPGGTDGAAVSPIGFSVMTPDRCADLQLQLLRARRTSDQGPCMLHGDGERQDHAGPHRTCAGAHHPRVRTVSGEGRRHAEGRHGGDLRDRHFRAC